MSSSEAAVAMPPMLLAESLGLGRITARPGAVAHSGQLGLGEEL
jgi:hypothetical protein